RSGRRSQSGNACADERHQLLQLLDAGVALRHLDRESLRRGEMDLRLVAGVDRQLGLRPADLRLQLRIGDVGRAAGWKPVEYLHGLPEECSALVNATDR